MRLLSRAEATHPEAGPPDCGTFGSAVRDKDNKKAGGYSGFFVSFSFDFIRFDLFSQLRDDMEFSNCL